MYDIYPSLEFEPWNLSKLSEFDCNSTYCPYKQRLQTTNTKTV